MPGNLHGITTRYPGLNQVARGTPTKIVRTQTLIATRLLIEFPKAELVASGVPEDLEVAKAEYPSEGFGKVFR
jgi:hypothetical protein